MLWNDHCSADEVAARETGLRPYEDFLPLQARDNEMFRILC